MSLLEQLQSVVVKRELDLSELDESYIVKGKAIKLPFRVNWTRGQKKRHQSLRLEVDAMLKAKDQEGADIEALNKRSEEWYQHWCELWAELLLVSQPEVEQVIESLPGPHWQWVTQRIFEAVNQYEGEETKKVLGSSTTS